MFPFLDARYEFVETEDPEIIVFSCFVNGARQKHMPDPGSSGQTTVFFTGENVRPDMSRCDYAFSFAYDIDDTRHYFLPNYVVRMRFLGYEPEMLLQPRASLMAGKKRDRFCSFIAGHEVPFRESFVKALSQYKQVDCGGPRLNNIGTLVSVTEKIRNLTSYKFTIAFENEASSGYTTEKIVDAFIAGSAPLYWGDPQVNSWFNPEAFLNYSDYDSQDAFIERIKAYDCDDGLLRKMLKCPCFYDNRVPDVFSLEALESQWRMILG